MYRQNIGRQCCQEVDSCRATNHERFWHLATAGKRHSSSRAKLGRCQSRMLNCFRRPNILGISASHCTVAHWVACLVLCTVYSGSEISFFRTTKHICVWKKLSLLWKVELAQIITELPTQKAKRGPLMHSPSPNSASKVVAHFCDTFLDAWSFSFGLIAKMATVWSAYNRNIFVRQHAEQSVWNHTQTSIHSRIH